MTPLIWTLVFLAAFMFVEFLALATAGVRSRGRERSRSRLRELALRLHPKSAEEHISILREHQPLGARLRATRAPFMERLDLLLYRAGQPFGLTRFLVLSGACALAGSVLGNLILHEPLLGIAFTGFGLLPFFAVLMKKRSRMKKFEVMFPEALDLLARSLRAGHALTAGLQMIADELEDPIGTEFGQLAEEIRYGLELNVALSNLNFRIDVPDMPFFVTALLIQRETGGNLAEVVDNLSAIIRARHSTYGKIRAMVAQMEWSANILLVAPFAFLIAMSMTTPDYIAPLFETDKGNTILMTAMAMVGVGYVVCRRVGVVRV
jgi:tight adherence protein B